MTSNERYARSDNSVAGQVLKIVATRPDAVLGIAAGSSPLAIYRELSRKVSEGALDFADVRAFGLDEYVGLSPEHPEVV